MFRLKGYCRSEPVLSREETKVWSVQSMNCLLSLSSVDFIANNWNAAPGVTLLAATGGKSLDFCLDTFALAVEVKHRISAAGCKEEQPSSSRG